MLMGNGLILFIIIISGNFLFLALIFLLFIAKVHPSLPSNKNQVPVFAATLFFVLMENMLEIKRPKSIQTFDNSSSSISGKSLLYALMFIPQVTQKSSVYALMFIPRGTIVPNSLIHSDSRTWRHSNKLHCIVLRMSF